MTIEEIAKWLLSKKAIGHVAIAVDKDGLLTVSVRVRASTLRDAVVAAALHPEEALLNRGEVGLLTYRVENLQRQVEQLLEPGV